METGKDADLEGRIAAVRHFNRFYTRQIRVVQDKLLSSRFSLAEANVLYEILHRDEPTATELSADLRVDPGYLSRILRRLERAGLVERRPSERDRRQSLLALTAAGRKAFGELDRLARDDVRELLAPVEPADQRRLLGAMRTIEGVLGDGTADGSFLVLRPHEPGDLGWIVERHGVLYEREYGWGARFEALVARIAADFLADFDPARERCWIAELGGQRVGCVVLVADSDEVARLRLLLVEPAARGHGLGRRLIQECIRFARRTGYRKLTLWTRNQLTAARRLYQEAGFRRVREEANEEIDGVVEEAWDLDLAEG